MMRKAIIEIMVRKATAMEMYFIARLENISDCPSAGEQSEPSTATSSYPPKFCGAKLRRVLKLLPVSHCLRLAQQTNSHVYNFKAKREFSKDSA